jgi:hypothetical protein
LSDAPIAMLLCSLDACHPALDWFPDPAADTRHFLAVMAKTSVPKGIQVFNLAANYPRELARIESLAAITEARKLARPQLWDSLQLFGLRQLLTLERDVMQVALLRGPMIANPASLRQAFRSQSQPFASLADDPALLLFDRSKVGAELTLSLALDMVLSGAIYGLGAYRLESLLEQVQQVVAGAQLDDLIELQTETARGADAAERASEKS